MNLEHKQHGVLVKYQCLCAEDLNNVQDLAAKINYHRAKLAAQGPNYNGVMDTKTRRCWTSKSSEAASLDRITRPLFEEYLSTYGIHLSEKQQNDCFTENYIIKYKAEDVGFFDWHQDVIDTDPPRVVSLSLMLNSQYTGGNFVFKHGQQESEVDLCENSCVMFTPNIPHKVTPITSGSRYVVVSWLHCPVEYQISEHLSWVATN